MSIDKGLYWSGNPSVVSGFRTSWPFTYDERLRRLSESSTRSHTLAVNFPEIFLLRSLMGSPGHFPGTFYQGAGRKRVLENVQSSICRAVKLECIFSTSYRPFPISQCVQTFHLFLPYCLIHDLPTLLIPSKIFSATLDVSLSHFLFLLPLIASLCASISRSS